MGRTITKASGLGTVRVNETTFYDADDSIDGDSPRFRVERFHNFVLDSVKNTS